MFSHPEVVALLARAAGLETPSVLAVEGDGRWLAALPLFERTRGPFRALVAPVLIPVVSPLLAESATEAEVHRHTSPLDVLLAALPAEVHRATFLLHPSLTDLRPFQWAGWTTRTRYTYLLDLARPADPLDAWSGGARRTAKKAMGDYVFEEDPAHADAALALMTASYARQGEPLALPDRVRALLREMIEGGFARAFAVRPASGHEPEAALVVAHDDRTAHYWIAGSEPGPAMTVLLAHLLPLLQADGIAAFDFLGANVPSIAEFKRRFGPTLQPYALATQDFHPALRLLRRITGQTG